MLNKGFLEIFWPLQKGMKSSRFLLRHTHRTEVINEDLTGYLFNKGNKPKHKEGWLKKEFLNKL